MTAVKIQQSDIHRDTEWSYTNSGLCIFKYGSLKSVIIPETVKTIGEMSFANCDVLTDVTIATGVTSIGTAAFVRCALESITIPASVTEIGADAFYGIGTLKEVKVEGTNPASIGGSAFGETWFVTNGEKESKYRLAQ